MSNKNNAGAVVCPEPLAAAAGGKMLERGGNAIDAVVAAAFAQGVVNPLLCGIGGTGTMLVHKASDPVTVIVTGRGGAGSKARPDTYRVVGPSVYLNRFVVEGHESYIGHKAVVIPTLVRCLWGAHTRFGKLPWKELLQPAIELAADGFEVYPYLFRCWNPDAEHFGDSPHFMTRLKATPESVRIYLRDGDQVYCIGEVLKQPDYARTLQRIADKGADVFYRGEIAHAIAADFEAHDGLITLEDLRACSTVLREPTEGSYHGYRFLTDGSPQMGPLEVQALHMLDYLQPAKWGWRSPRYFDTMARVFQTIYADRLRYNGDARFVDVPLHKFLSKERAKKLAENLDQQGELHVEAAPEPDESTTHVSAMDAWGNAAGITHSNGNSSGVVTPGLGFLYNHHMHNFDPRPGYLNSIAPGKAYRGGCSPVMFMRDGDRDVMVVNGSLSRWKVTGELQTLVSVLDYGKDVQTAVCQPRIHAEYDPETLYIESSMPPNEMAPLEELGWKTRIATMKSPMCMIWVDEQKRMQLAVDPRGDGGHWPA